MPSPRWLAILAVPVMACAALVTGAAIATADPADDAYLAQLRAVGFSWPPDHEAALTGMGRLICDDLGWGWTYEQIAQQIHATLDPRKVSFGDVGTWCGSRMRSTAPPSGAGPALLAVPATASWRVDRLCDWGSIPVQPGTSRSARARPTSFHATP
jgi:hypothetical protein